MFARAAPRSRAASSAPRLSAGSRACGRQGVSAPRSRAALSAARLRRIPSTPSSLPAGALAAEAASGRRRRVRGLWLPRAWQFVHRGICFSKRGSRDRCVRSDRILRDERRYDRRGPALTRGARSCRDRAIGRIPRAPHIGCPSGQSVSSWRQAGADDATRRARGRWRGTQAGGTRGSRAAARANLPRSESLGRRPTGSEGLEANRAASTCHGEAPPSRGTLRLRPPASRRRCHSPRVPRHSRRTNAGEQRDRPPTAGRSHNASQPARCQAYYQPCSTRPRRTSCPNCCRSARCGRSPRG